MIKNSFLKPILFALAVVLFAACDNDFNVLGTDLVGVDNFGFGTPVTYDVNTTNVDLGAVESTNLQVNPLGIYDNPVFGETKANFVTQVLLANENPTIDLTKELDVFSVVLRIPYYTRSTGAPYTLDSIYGRKPYSKMKLSVYESKYFIRDLNPADQLPQAYYTNDNALFENSIAGDTKLNDSADTSQNSDFYISNSVTTTTTYDSAGVVTANTAAAPAISLNLNTDYFKNKILNAPAGKLLSNNAFKDYFRGLYFKVEKSGNSSGNLAMLNFRGGTVTINYTENPVGNSANKTYKSIVLAMTGKSVSLIEQGSRVAAPDSKNLFLKGGADNSMAVIDINESDLRQMKDSNWLINDASITFNVDKAKMNAADSFGKKAAEPLRVYLYDLNNKRQLADYTFDQTTYYYSAKFNKYVFGGILNREAVAADGIERRGQSYKIRLTSHIRNLIQNAKDVQPDTLARANVRLGLVVTETINDAAFFGNKRLKNPALSNTIKAIPAMSVAHPLGTILFGSNIPAGDPDYDKRPKLQIYYTQLK